MALVTVVRNKLEQGTFTLLDKSNWLPIFNNNCDNDQRWDQAFVLQVTKTMSSLCTQVLIQDWQIPRQVPSQDWQVSSPKLWVSSP